LPFDTPRGGIAVLRLDADGVASFARLYQGGELGPDEIKLRYRLVTAYGSIRYGADGYFFQEGQGGAYRNARYGVLRVADDGASILVGLAGEDKKLIVPPAPEE
jgi:uncharacterized membrane-anchored protein